MQCRNKWDGGLTLGGIVALLVGSLLPLFRVNPSRPADAPVPLGYAPEQSIGIHGIDSLFLILAGMVGMMLITERLQLHRATLSVFTGLVAVGFPLHYLFVASVGVDATATFVPTHGWYGLVGGGILLVIAGGRHLSGRLQRLATATSWKGIRYAIQSNPSGWTVGGVYADR